MFAFAIWDRHERRLHLARDRIGEKPLYLATVPGGWLFASELKAIRVHPRFVPEVDRNALASFLRHGYVPAPWCIYRGVQKLRQVPSSASPRERSPRSRFYWSARAAFETGATHPFHGSSEDALEQVETLLRESVRMRMQADVPLGAFLSGGIDSSTIVAMMQSQSTKRVRTFTIGFPEGGFDEAVMARDVASHVGTDHSELYVTGEDARAIIPGLPDIYDEPFADSSGIPTILVSRLARGSVTVSLSGDGGDELFGGYSRYLLAETAWNWVSRIPAPLRPAASSVLAGVPEVLWRQVTRLIGPLMPSRVNRLASGSRRKQLAQLLESKTRQRLYQDLVSVWHQPETIALGSREPATPHTDPLPRGLPGFLSEMTFLDTVSYLPDDILVKLDRASMSVASRHEFPCSTTAWWNWRQPCRVR